MRKWHLAAALAAVAAIPGLSAGCNPAPLGEIILVVTTDMAPPKDFNKMRIQVFREGKLQFEYEDLVPGDPNNPKRIVLPSTFGLVAPDKPADAIRIEVGVRSGDKDGPVRVVREVVTTIPADRVAQLDIPIQFLCKSEAIPFDNDGNLQTGCDAGKTCIAGLCVDSVIDSATLPDYDPKTVFGGGSDATKGVCFDVATCLEAADLIDKTGFDSLNCTFPVPKNIATDQLNLALGVESDGICNGRGCFIVLDANSDTGWKLDDAKANIVLPKGVCANLDGNSPSSLKVLQIVQAATADGCPQKDATYPTCGPWSAIDSSSAAVNVPASLAGAQDHPVSVTVLNDPTGNFAYWSNGGSSSIKGINLDGGAIISIDSPEPPRDIRATSKALLWTAAGANGLGSIYAQILSPAMGQPAQVQLKTGLAQPDGVAFFGDKTLGNKLFWTEFKDPGSIYVGVLNANFSAFTDVQELAKNNSYPARMVADSTYVYWTNEGTFDKKDGTVARIQHAVQGPTKLVLTPTPMAAPRAIAIDESVTGTDLYFATIADGTVWRISKAATDTPDAPVEFATGLSAPNGIAIDGKNVFISNRGDGSVVYKDKTADKTVAPKTIATGQKNPGTILINNGILIWVNEGPSASDTKEGSIVKFDASKL